MEDKKNVRALSDEELEKVSGGKSKSQQCKEECIANGHSDGMLIGGKCTCLIQVS